MKKKVYVSRHPRIGDTVEAICKPFAADHEVGYEYEIVKLRSGYIVVTGERMPFRKTEITILDGDYTIVEYRDVPIPKETHVKTYKFLGIPFMKRTTYIYE
jgi:hypothetical protein